MLRFNGTRFIKDVERICNRELDKVAKILVEFMIGEISQIPQSGTIDAVGKPDWRLDVIEALKFIAKIEGSMLVRDVGLIEPSDNLKMKAMIIEFGMGTEADMKNPWIDEYFSSEYYHSERGGMSVFGRKDKEVYDIDDDTWYESTANHDKEIPYFRQRGSHFWTKIFGNSKDLARSYFNAALSNVHNSIRIKDYIENK